MTNKTKKIKKNQVYNLSNVIKVNFHPQGRPDPLRNGMNSLANRPSNQPRGLSLEQSQTKMPKNSTVINILPRISEEKRKTRRIVMSGLMNTALVVPNGGLIRDVSLHNISETGISFDLPFNFKEAFKVKEKLTMRVYLNSEDFFDFNIVITKNIRHIPEEGICRYGCRLLPNERSEKAINSLIHFIESVSHILHKDKGEVLLYK